MQPFKFRGVNNQFVCYRLPAFYRLFPAKSKSFPTSKEKKTLLINKNIPNKFKI